MKTCHVFDESFENLTDQTDTKPVLHETCQTILF